MYYYRIAEITLESVYKLASYSAFACEGGPADVRLKGTTKLPEAGKDCYSGTIVHRRTADGWFFHPRGEEQIGLYVNQDYTLLRLLGQKKKVVSGFTEWFIRIGLECFLARRGYVSLHAAAVETGGHAYAFSAPSGVGKSTRAKAWQEGIGAELINGDRPLIDARRMVLYGVPWDGKEQCFRNVCYPLKAICEVRRSDSVYVRKMSFAQRRKLLLRQCFLPMWDTETAAVQMANITAIASKAEIVRVFSGPEKKDACALYDALNKDQYLKEEPDMKAKAGFVLRNVVDEHILMPTGDNIGKFNGTVLLNDVSALVWEKLQNPISREDLLQAILDEFEVEKAIASADLDKLLETLRGYGIIEDD